MSGDGGKVLCVLSDEQAESYRDYFAGLQLPGVDLVVEPSAEDALERIGRTGPRAVIVGMTIGAMEGLEFIATAMRRYGEYGGAFIVLPERDDPFPPMLQRRDPSTGRSSTEQTDLDSIGTLLEKLADQGPAKPSAPARPMVAGRIAAKDDPAQARSKLASAKARAELASALRQATSTAPARPTTPAPHQRAALAGLDRPTLRAPSPAESEDRPFERGPDRPSGRDPAHAGAPEGAFSEPRFESSEPPRVLPAAVPGGEAEEAGTAAGPADVTPDGTEPAAPEPGATAPEPVAPDGTEPVPANAAPEPVPANAAPEPAVPEPESTRAPEPVPATTAPEPAVAVPANAAAPAPGPKRLPLLPVAAIAGVGLLVLIAVAAWWALSDDGPDRASADGTPVSRDGPPTPSETPDPMAETEQATAEPSPSADQGARADGPPAEPAETPAEPAEAPGFAEPTTLPLRFTRGEARYAVSDSAQLEGLVSEALALLGRDPTARLEVGGHTSTEGSERYNRALGRRRARRVRRQLVERGADPARVVVRSYGSSMPRVPAGSGADAREANRRVTLLRVD